MIRHAHARSRARDRPAEACDYRITRTNNRVQDAVKVCYSVKSGSGFYRLPAIRILQKTDLDSVLHSVICSCNLYSPACKNAGGSVLQFVTWGVLANSAGGSVLQFVTWGVLANSAGGSVLQFVTHTSPQAWAAKMQ